MEDNTYTAQAGAQFQEIGADPGLYDPTLGKNVGVVNLARREAEHKVRCQVWQVQEACKTIMHNQLIKALPETLINKLKYDIIGLQNKQIQEPLNVVEGIKKCADGNTWANPCDRDRAIQKEYLEWMQRTPKSMVKKAGVGVNAMEQTHQTPIGVLETTMDNLAYAAMASSIQMNTIMQSNVTLTEQVKVAMALLYQEEVRLVEEESSAQHNIPDMLCSQFAYKEMDSVTTDIQPQQSYKAIPLENAEDAANIYNVTLSGTMIVEDNTNEAAITKEGSLSNCWKAAPRLVCSAGDTASTETSTLSRPSAPYPIPLYKQKHDQDFAALVQQTEALEGATKKHAEDEEAAAVEAEKQMETVEKDKDTTMQQLKA
eukprot:15334520-Ditylum_brightwellii.AAC.1